MKLTFSVNNGRALCLEQGRPDGPVTVSRQLPDGRTDASRTYGPRTISPEQFVMLNSLYWHIMDNDIQNDFINPNGKNRE